MEPKIEGSYHYKLIARAISVLDECDGDKIPLDDLAAKMNMSSAHFQKLFSRWVGVSPKRYQQYLALDHARSLLRNRSTTLETSISAGLSSQGRLHDLFLRWESMTPGEFARKGAGLTIRWGWFESPFGEMLAMGTTRGLCGIAFAAECGRDMAFADLAGRWPLATLVEDGSAISQWVQAALDQKGQSRLHLMGAPFQIKVWEALLVIPSGQVATYSEIARSAELPKAARAAGTAVGRNPISWLIPCHRVIRKSGDLGGYHWGLPIKRALLAWESARVESRLA